MTWQPGHALPYDGWYGGRVDMMIKNGTYADFRPKVVSRCERGFYSKKGTLEEKKADCVQMLKKWDAEWNNIPVEERIKRRDKVADDVEIKEKIVYTARGPVRVFRSKPSMNNNMAPNKGDIAQKKNRKLPPGFISKGTSSESAVSIPSSAPAQPATAGVQESRGPANPNAVPQQVGNSNPASQNFGQKQ